MSDALDNARRIGAALTESELPGEAELRRIVGAQLHAAQNGIDLLDGDAIDGSVVDLRRLQVPQSQQVDAEATVVPGSESVDPQMDARVSAIEQGQQQIIALLTQRAPMGGTQAPDQPPAVAAQTDPAPTPDQALPTPAPAPGGDQQDAPGLQVASTPVAEPVTPPADQPDAPDADPVAPGAGFHEPATDMGSSTDQPVVPASDPAPRSPEPGEQAVAPETPDQPPSTS